VPANNTMNPTAGGALLLPRRNRGARTCVDEVGPPAAGERKR
jgi:hypothetical protein